MQDAGTARRLESANARRKLDVPTTPERELSLAEAARAAQDSDGAGVLSDPRLPLTAHELGSHPLLSNDGES